MTPTYLTNKKAGNAYSSSKYVSCVVKVIFTLVFHAAQTCWGYCVLSRILAKIQMPPPPRGGTAADLPRPSRDPPWLEMGHKPGSCHPSQKDIKIKNLNITHFSILPFWLSLSDFFGQHLTSICKMPGKCCVRVRDGSPRQAASNARAPQPGGGTVSCWVQWPMLRGSCYDC